MREFGSTFEIEYLPDKYFEDMASAMPYSAFTRSGREAIGLILHGMPPGIALLPAYCCWSMSLPFEVAGWDVQYYPINKDLSVNLLELEALLNKIQPQLVLVVDYFGFAPTYKAVELIKAFDKDVVVLEDFTQNLFNFNEKRNPKVDCYVASIRKSIGVPDGGVVLSNLPLYTDVLSNSKNLFVEDHIEAGVLKKMYAYSYDQSLKNTFRQLQSEAGSEIKRDYNLYRISNESSAILALSNIRSIRYAREENYKHLYDLVGKNPHFEVLFKPQEGQTPFMFVVKSAQRDTLQQELAKLGVYCQVIWPISEMGRRVCPVAKDMEDTMLAIPIDQRYDFYDVEEIGNRINSIEL